MEAASAARRGPGRPPSGAQERILAAALEVLKRDGYAGMTTAKVAAASGQNKALISYYFGSKQGLVAAAARRVSEMLVAEVLGGLGEPRSVGELVAGLLAGVERMTDRDEGLQRVYFDLSSQSIVDPEVSSVLGEMKAGYRAILRELLAELEDGPPARDRDAAALFLVAGVEGLALERLDRGETREFRRARELFVAAAGAAIARPAGRDRLGSRRRENERR